MKYIDALKKYNEKISGARLVKVQMITRKY